MLIDLTPTEPNRATLEPGLLSVFRLILGVMLGLQVLTLLFFGYAIWSGETPPKDLPIDILIWLSIAEPIAILLLLLFLFSARLQRRLNRYYLPVAVALFSVGAIVQRYLFLLLVILPVATTVMEDVELQTRLEGNAWILVLTLLAPLVMVAWQYDFKRVVWFVVASALFEIVLVWFFVPADMPAWLFTNHDVSAAASTDDAAALWEVPGMVDALFFILLPRTVIFLAVGYIVTRMIGAQRQQRLALAAANGKLREHAATLEQLTLSRERNRLARELHDTLAHTLSAVSIQLEAVDSAWTGNPEQARLLLNKSLAQTRSGLTETRRALQALRASPLDDLGLALALRNLAESTAKRGALQLQVQIDEGLGQLTPDLEQNLYRVAQEALTNVLKHAGATQLQLFLVAEQGKVALTIHDNGNGFDPATDNNNGHYGLRGMQERAEVMGGTLAVQSKPGAGTTVRLTVGK